MTNNTMRKKILFLLVLLALLVGYHSVQAAIAVPYLNITINKTAAGGDDNFNFHIRAYPAGSPISHLDEQISVQTTCGSGTEVFYGISGNGDRYYITEDVLGGWQNTGASCSSDNPNITFSPVQNGI